MELQTPRNYTRYVKPHVFEEWKPGDKDHLTITHPLGGVLPDHLVSRVRMKIDKETSVIYRSTRKAEPLTISLKDDEQEHTRKKKLTEFFGG